MAQSKDSQERKPRTSVFFPCLLLFGLPAAFCIYQGDFVTAAVLAYIGVGCVMGFKVGTIGTLIFLAGLAVIAWLVPRMTFKFEEQLTEWFSTTGLTNRLISVGIIFFVFMTVIFYYGNWIANSLIKKQFGIRALNSWFGLLIGAAKSVAVVLLVLGGLAVMEPLLVKAPQGGEEVEQSWTTTQVQNVNALTAKSYVGPLVEKYNPFTNYPQLNFFPQIIKTAEVMQEPAGLKQIINDPGFANLEDQPDLLAAIEEVKAEENITAILESDEPYGWDGVKAIMDSPGVLHILEQPAFYSEAANVIEDANR